jgi:GH25 family lysozyme M1 (1,4-beta-N-acetylmuramidase)
MSTTVQQATAAAASTTLNGVDVSSFQHPNNAAINWASVHSAGYNFAAIKATEGNYYVNNYYASDAAAATAAGMYVAAYHFANPPDSSGTAQADYAVKNAGTYHVGGHYLPLVLDLEYDPYSSNECFGLSPTQMVSWISDFMKEATTLTGAAPTIYTPTSWWDTCTANSTAFGKDVLWVPAYSAGTPGTLPAGWSTWTMWQYTSSGTVPGISGSVDLDYFSGGPQVEQTALNTAASVQIETLNALAGQQVTYSATGLPPGPAMSAAGLITGAATVAGSYPVTVTPSSSEPVLPATVSFTWEVTGPPAVAVGAEGPHDQLWVQAPQLGSGWHSLGGMLIAPPAVAAAPNTDASVLAPPLFIATSTNKQLYIRSLTAGWQRLGSASMPCTGGPAAVITGGTLTVACRGTNNALWENSAPVPSSGLPQFTNPWANLGGVLTAGPAVAPVGGTMTFFAPSTSGRIWTRTLTSGYSATPWVCIGSPAAAQGASSGTTFACQGGDHALYVATNAGAGWSSEASLGGSLIGGPGVGATSLSTDLLAEGSNHAVWQRTPLTGWSSLGGSVVGGVGAAALN